MKSKILLLLTVLTLITSCGRPPSNEIEEECYTEHYDMIYNISDEYNQSMSTFCNTCSAEDCTRSVDITIEYLEQLRQVWSDLAITASNCSEGRLRDLRDLLDNKLTFLEDRYEIFLTDCP